MVEAAFIKKLARLKKKQRKFHVFFFEIGVRGPKQKLGRGADAPPSPPLLANFVDSLLIGNRPPWHLTLVICTSHARFWLHSRTGESLTHAAVKPESPFVRFPR